MELYKYRRLLEIGVVRRIEAVATEGQYRIISSSNH
jgi:hypothetical protein